MSLSDHSDLIGKHAFLSPSNWHWINDDDEKLVSRYLGYLATQRGTELHDYARQAIMLRRKQPRTRDTVNRYINDAIGFGMKPEQVQFYSYNAFGTADAILFKNGLLRVHDLKTGVTPAKMEQLMLYATYWCLENNYEPKDIDMELRIYQSEDTQIMNPDPADIKVLMDKTIHADQVIQKLREEEL